MARKRKKSDDIYNARRRLRRAIDRAREQMRKAVSSTEIDKQKLLISEAKRKLKRVEKVGKQLYKGDITLKEAKDKVERISKKSLAGNTRQVRRERTARNIMSTSIGSRIIGAFEEFWNREGENRDIEDVIFERVGVSSWAELLSVFEEKYPDIYKEPDSDEMYDTVKQAIMLDYAG